MAVKKAGPRKAQAGWRLSAAVHQDCAPWGVLRKYELCLARVGWMKSGSSEHGEAYGRKRDGARRKTGVISIYEYGVLEKKFADDECTHALLK